MNGRDFRRGATAALDGAVHVALPLIARVFSREEQPAGRTCEPRSQRRIERWIEERVSAACPRILVPGDLS